MFISNVLWLGSDRPSRLFFMPALRLSILIYARLSSYRLCLYLYLISFLILLLYIILYIYNIILFIIIFWLGCDRPSGLLFIFGPVLLLSILTPLFLPSSSVSLSYFVLAVPMREWLGKHSCMSSLFPIAILNGTFLSREAK